ncbi:MAG: hypothetical protein LBG52_06565 [Candidatus Peribacteria bacterium]|jgi:hypothetical protein|nr:hypothetical protein [Candidatus Peribacteria bacterium]
MTIETISLSKEATLGMLLQKIAKRDKRYVISVEGSRAFEVSPLEDEEITPAMQKAYKAAKDDYEKGVNMSTLDLGKIKTVQDFHNRLHEDEE